MLMSPIKLIAYASDRAQEGTTDIWVQQIAGGEPVRLTKGLGLCHSPSFSPDGSRIAFHGGPDSKGVFVTSTLGGGARRIAADGRAPEFSPDGTTLAYMAADSSRIMVVPAMGGTPRELQTKHTVLERAHWLPDSKRLLSLGVDPGAPNPSGERREDWYTISLDGAEASAGAAPWLNDPFDRVGPHSVSSDGVMMWVGTLDSSNVYRVPFDVIQGNASPAPRAGHRRAGIQLLADGQY